MKETMPEYQNSFKEYFRSLNVPVASANGVLWVSYKRMIQACAPILQNTIIDDNQARSLLRSSGKVLVRCSRPINSGTSNWYAVIKDNHTSIEDYSASTRSKIRRGMKRNTVRRIDATYLAEKGYPVYIRAHKRYRSFSGRVMAKGQYIKNCLAILPYNNIIHIWGIFQDENLCGYSINYVFGTSEVFLETVIFDPDYLRDYSSYAFYQTMNDHYLGELGFSYLNEGLRNLVHDTNIYEFLESNFLFHKNYLELSLFYHPLYGKVFDLSKPALSCLGRHSQRINALLLLDEAANHRTICSFRKHKIKPQSTIIGPFKFQSTGFTYNQINEIVESHHTSIKGGFLSTLPGTFLRKLYKAIASDPNSHITLAIDMETESCIGFIVGTIDIRSMYKRIILRHGFFFLIVLLGKAFHYSVLKRMFETLTYPFFFLEHPFVKKMRESSKKDSHAELLIIVVRDDYRRKGIGRALVEDLNLFFRQNNIFSYNVITSQDKVSNAFYQGLRFTFAETLSYHGNTMHKYIKVL